MDKPTFDYRENAAACRRLAEAAARPADKAFSLKITLSLKTTLARDALATGGGQLQQRPLPDHAVTK